ncbi:NAD(P)/FAD-dependent oxidoreductase [Papillibacter cinnamivorans]|uniref:Aminoacetone oxidase family FAD-binding enzyme n=1 Tax=Papillibacter cinnamivorans DSM 12816 TaxID=1122930 RepID=A0A1W1YVT5_9FIRM|nr:NAD(P)/FAD-dependent oxidoreductase [Papillibacter cinnamivorans]SMC39931.1 hypothetical protein SAMN02745168_0680 [Papillibacter cinnamivorans DSM 12816]
MKNKVVVVGGGAAGMLAACAAAQRGLPVLLLERNGFLGKKLNITGKGRCNLTNDCTVEAALSQIPRNGRFLYGALSRFSPSRTKEYFEALGVPLKTERGERVFPESDRAKDVSGALIRSLKTLNVETVQARAAHIRLRDGAVSAVEDTSGSLHPASSVILATGGLSYPLTGSDGDGYRMAAELGHTVTPLGPSLVPLESPDPDCVEMKGLSLKNVAVRVADKSGKTVYRDFGELLFTHFGLSGPVILSASAHMRSFDKTEYTVSIDLKPALAPEALDERILRDFKEFSNRDFANSLDKLLPRAMIPVAVRRSGIPPDTKVHSVTREQRSGLAHLLKHFEIPVSGPRPVEEAVVTSGGISIKEVSPSTMESKLVPGLFFAGEILDVDGYTGGFNLQIAWATGHLAGSSAR